MFLCSPFLPVLSQITDSMPMLVTLCTLFSIHFNVYWFLQPWADSSLYCPPAFNFFSLARKGIQPSYMRASRQLKIIYRCYVGAMLLCTLYIYLQIRIKWMLLWRKSIWFAGLTRLLVFLCSLCFSDNSSLAFGNFSCRVWLPAIFTGRKIIGMNLLVVQAVPVRVLSWNKRIAVIIAECDWDLYWYFVARIVAMNNEQRCRIIVILKLSLIQSKSTTKNRFSAQNMNPTKPSSEWVK